MLLGRMSFTVLLAAPRGFCAGVERAIRTVELALDGRAAGDDRPVYVRHEIVHNKVVVDDLRTRGAVFVEDTLEIPTGATAVFSAHGIAPSVPDAESAEVDDPRRVAYATQTTLSLDDVSAIVEVLRRRFPDMVGPETGDICYATTNRQEAVRALVDQHGADVVLVLGSPNSSNSNRLREVAEMAGARGYLLGSAE